MSKKETIITGLQPSGKLTLGNYIGAIKQMVKMQEEYNTYMFIADMHAITVYQDPEKLSKKLHELIAIYLACGINPDNTTIFIQSENVYHANVSWMLECTTPFGELSRMTQFKDKSSKNASFGAGLFTYPVLMAADILIYDVDFVPVGIDQKQHVELARNIAERFNKKYGETFKIPDVKLAKSGTKIMDLQDPSKKMSKSEENPKGVIYLLDEPEVIRKKIMSATTDSDCLVKFDEKNKPGISNLMNIVISLTGESIEDIENKFQNKNYGEFKSYVADIVVNELTNIKTKYEQISNSNIIPDILEKGLEVTSKIAKEKYLLMKKNMGLYIEK